MQSMTRTRTAVLAALLAFTLCNSLLSAKWGLPDGATAETTSTWAVDTVAPLGPLNEANNLFTRRGVDDVIYPVFHYVVLAGAYAPYIAVALMTGELANPSSDFPYGAAEPTTFFVHLTLIASLVSALMAVGCVLLSYLIARETFGVLAALWTALLAALVPPLAYYGAMPNLDVPYLFWTMLSVWMLLRAARLQNTASYLWCGVCASLAVATKDQAAGFLITLPIVIPLLVRCGLRREGKPDGPLAILRDRRVWVAALAAAATFVVANNLVTGLEGYRRHLAFADEFYAANLAADGPGLLARQPALLAHSSSLLVQMVGIPALLLIAAGVWATIRARRRVALFLLLSPLGYYAAIIVPTVAHSRYLLGVVLLLLPFAGHAIVLGLASRRALLRVSACIALAGAVVWQGLLIAHLHRTLAQDSRRAMEAVIRERIPAGTVIESSTQARYLPRISDAYRYSIVGNSFSSTSYNLVGDALTLEALKARNPAYVLVLADSWVSGDPTRVEEAQIRAYYDALLSGQAGYEIVADLRTPTWLPYRQITAGTQPRSILLRRRD